MLIEKDIVAELISKTRSGVMQWHPQAEGMSTGLWYSHSECGSFVVQRDGVLEISTAGNNSIISEIPQIQELVDVLSERFKAYTISDDEALENVLECLKR